MLGNGSATLAPNSLRSKCTLGQGTLMIRAELDRPIDARKAKAGDQVLAKTTDDPNSTAPPLATKGAKSQDMWSRLCCLRGISRVSLGTLGIMSRN
jgi:hypothetical protein